MIRNPKAGLINTSKIGWDIVETGSFPLFPIYFMTFYWHIYCCYSVYIVFFTSASRTVRARNYCHCSRYSAAKPLRYYFYGWQSDLLHNELQKYIVDDDVDNSKQPVYFYIRFSGITVH